MATKIGAGGHRQNYDPRTGRYAKMTYTDYVRYPPTRKERARRREELRRLELYNRAKNSRDPYVFDAYLAIENALPGAVMLVNEIRLDRNINNVRELDIATRKCIIEVKSGKASGDLKQFLAQKRFAEWKNKKHVVFAPDIFFNTKRAYENNGIVVKNDITDLIKFIKENEK